MKKSTTSHRAEGGQLRTAIYLHVSDPTQVEGYSLDAQERACREYVAARGWAVVDIFRDEGISGRSDERPELQRLVALARNRHIQVVVVHNLDRLVRNLRLQLNLKAELDLAGVRLVSVTDEIDTSTPEGIAHFQMKGVFAEWYSNNLGREVRKGLTEKARNGGWVGPVPLGYKKSADGDLVPSVDAEAVRRIFAWYASDRYSYTDVADDLNARGYRTLDWRTGERRLFGRESIRTILKNPAYYGVVQCGGHRYEGKHEPLVTQEVWSAAQAVREDRDTKGGKTVVNRG